jgi:hypothetical protein
MLEIIGGYLVIDGHGMALIDTELQGENAGLRGGGDKGFLERL